MPKYTATWTEVWQVNCVSEPFEADSVEQAADMIRDDTHGAWTDVTDTTVQVGPRHMVITLEDDNV